MFGDEIAELVGKLSSKDEAERQGADMQLRSLNGSDVANLLAWSRSCDSGRRVVNGCSGCATAGCGIYAIVGILSVISSFVDYGTDLEEIAIKVVFTAAGIACARVAWQVIKPRDITVEQETLSRVEDPLVCIPILQSILGVNDKVKRAAGDSLVRLLPRLTAADGAEFPRTAREAIHRLLLTDAGYAFRAEVIVSALRSLEPVGDTSSVRALERLLRQPIYNNREQRIHAAAGPVLEALKNRIYKESQGNTLLRAAGNGIEESLLRASAASPSDDPQALLRPVEGRSERN